MQIYHNLNEWRGKPCAVLVPTMGALHEGHLSLVKEAKRIANGRAVWVSIFVNPLQFGEGEDYTRYPRPFEADCALLEKLGVEALIAPTVEAMYPTPQTYTIHPDPTLTSTLEGAYRPGHFQGVATVVMKLLQLTQPQILILGQKDYQQCKVVSGMIQQFNIPATLRIAPTIRADDGLALSSRNIYLSEDERKIAPTIYRTLQSVKSTLIAGERDYTKLENSAINALKDAGFAPDYVTIRTRERLEAPTPTDKEWVVLCAAKLGKTRLIDNIEVSF